MSSTLDAISRVGILDAISRVGWTLTGAASVGLFYCHVRNQQIDRKLSFQETLYKEGLSDEQINLYSNRLPGPRVDVSENAMVRAMKEGRN